MQHLRRGHLPCLGDTDTHIGALGYSKVDGVGGGRLVEGGLDGVSGRLCTACVESQPHQGLLNPQQLPVVATRHPTVERVERSKVLADAASREAERRVVVVLASRQLQWLHQQHLLWPGQRHVLAIHKRVHVGRLAPPTGI